MKKKLSIFYLLLVTGIGCALPWSSAVAIEITASFSPGKGYNSLPPEHFVFCPPPITLEQYRSRANFIVVGTVETSSEDKYKIHVLEKFIGPAQDVMEVRKTKELSQYVGKNQQLFINSTDVSNFIYYNILLY